MFKIKPETEDKIVAFLDWFERKSAVFAERVRNNYYSLGLFYAYALVVTWIVYLIAGFVYGNGYGACVLRLGIAAFLPALIFVAFVNIMSHILFKGGYSKKNFLSLFASWSVICEVVFLIRGYSLGVSVFETVAGLSAKIFGLALFFATVLYTYIQVLEKTPSSDDSNKETKVLPTKPES